VANLSPDWITSRINITAGTLDDATSVTVQLYDLNTSVPVIVKAEWETYATKGGDYHYDAWCVRI